MSKLKPVEIVHPQDEICFSCGGSGRIDLSVHHVAINHPTARCGKKRPNSKRRRSTDSSKVTCIECLRFLAMDELEKSRRSSAV
jgi:hypothetical protein